MRVLITGVVGRPVFAGGTVAVMGGAVGVFGIDAAVAVARERFGAALVRVEGAAGPARGGGWLLVVGRGGLGVPVVDSVGVVVHAWVCLVGMWGFWWFGLWGCGFCVCVRVFVLSGGWVL